VELNTAGRFRQKSVPCTWSHNVTKTNVIFRGEEDWHPGRVHEFIADRDRKRLFNGQGASSPRFTPAEEIENGLGSGTNRTHEPSSTSVNIASAKVDHSCQKHVFSGCFFATPIGGGGNSLARLPGGRRTRPSGCL